MEGPDAVDEMAVDDAVEEAEEKPLLLSEVLLAVGFIEDAAATASPFTDVRWWCGCW